MISIPLATPAIGLVECWENITRDIVAHRMAQHARRSPGTLVVVAVHRGSTPAVVANIPIAKGAHTLAIDAEGGRLYVPAGDFGPPTTAGGRPSLVAGTFKIQVLALKR